jgi:acyl-coenzyme A synthetase/AMP-(fatty) acid ligase/acyl carrier protein
MENQNIPQIIEKLVEEFPGHTVASDEFRRITYNEANRRANQLATQIVKSIGKDPNQISILIEHGVDQILAILAILKAGKCYIPLDINFPAERNKIFFDDSDSVLLITNNNTHRKAQEFTSSDKIINLDEIPENLPDQNLNMNFSPERRAVIYYTSGSSGKPKGVIHTHYSLIQSISSWPLSQNDIILNVFSCSFTIHHIPVIGALIKKATVDFFDIKKHSLSEMKAYFTDRKISVCIIVTSVFRQLLDTLTDGEPGIFSSLKKLITTGDPLYRNDVLKIFKIISNDIRIINMYGSTETLAVTFCEVTRDLILHDTIIPVGHPPEHVEITIHGENGQICKEYEIGKLYVKSPQVASSYWKHPELSHQFITDNNDKTLRTFITNDIGFRRKDGSIVLAGRDDTVVKVRGNTVDLSEIEKHIMENSTIREAFVVQKEFNSNKYLIAYYTTKFETHQIEFKIRKLLEKNLPDFMLPDFYTFLNQLPRTESGKISRKDFPEPDWSFLLKKGEDRFPENEIERSIAAIFEKASGISPIGTNQNIFDLSIDSLRILVIIDEIEKLYKTKIIPENVISAPFISKIAELVMKNMKNEQPDK